MQENSKDSVTEMNSMENKEKNEIQDGQDNSPKRKITSEDDEVENGQSSKKLKSCSENESIEDSSEETENKTLQTNDQSESNDISKDEITPKNVDECVSDSSQFKLYNECKLCGKQFNGPQTYLQHLSSIGHRKKAEAFGATSLNKKEESQNNAVHECKVCNKVFSGPVPLEQHFKGKGHRKNLILAELSAKFKDVRNDASDPSESGVENKSNSNQLSCQICNKKFTGLIPYDIHMSSALHNKKLQKLELAKNITVPENLPEDPVINDSTKENGENAQAELVNE